MKKITLEEATKMAEAVIEYGEEIGKPRFAIAVVDSGGHLVYFYRMPEAKFGPINCVIDKAYSAIAMKKPTRMLTYFKVGGHSEGFTNCNPRITPWAGGLPIVHNGEYIGGVACGGAHPDQDEEAARRALKSCGYPTEYEKIQVGEWTLKK